MNSLTKQSTEIKIAVPWGHIAAKVYGSQSNIKILVVHGVMDNAGSFDRLLNLLPEEPQYVSIDLPGHGLSSPFPPGLPLKFFDYVYAVSLVLDALEWKTCIYLAHSFGAQIGTYLSLMLPGRIKKLILIDGILPNAIKNLHTYIQSLYNLKSYTKDPGTLYTKEEVIYALKFRRGETLTTEAAEALAKRAVTEVNGLYKFNRDPRLRLTPNTLIHLIKHKEILINYCTPSLVIVAENSQKIEIMSEVSHKLHQLVNGKAEFTIVYVPGNHDVHNNYPERVAPHICKFLHDDLKSKL